MCIPLDLKQNINSLRNKGPVWSDPRPLLQSHLKPFCPSRAHLSFPYLYILSSFHRKTGWPVMHQILCSEQQKTVKEPALRAFFCFCSTYKSFYIPTWSLGPHWSVSLGQQRPTEVPAALPSGGPAPRGPSAQDSSCSLYSLQQIASSMRWF